MRHLKAGRKFKRSPSHRRMLLRNLATAVLEHGKITTTLAKAKEAQPVVERLITLAKDGWDLAKFRRILTVVTKKSVAYNLYFDDIVPTEDGKGTKTVPAIAPRFKDRPGGYTRIYKLAKVRQGDASAMAVLSLLGADEKVASKPVRPAVAPAAGG
jgi:large subunit ribosomal protein L17